MSARLWALAGSALGWPGSSGSTEVPVGATRLASDSRFLYVAGNEYRDPSRGMDRDGGFLLVLWRGAALVHQALVHPTGQPTDIVASDGPKLRSLDGRSFRHLADYLNEKHHGFARDLGFKIVTATWASTP